MSLSRHHYRCAAEQVRIIQRCAKRELVCTAFADFFARMDESGRFDPATFRLACQPIADPYRRARTPRPKGAAVTTTQQAATSVASKHVDPIVPRASLDDATR